MSSISAPAGGSLINRNFFIDTASGIYSGACRVIKNVNQIQGNPAAFGRAVRIIGYLFTAIAPGTQTAMRAKLALADNLTDSLQVFDSANCLINDPWNGKSLCDPLAQLMFLGSGVGSGVLFMDELNILSLPNVAAETGGWSIFSQVTKSTLGKIVNIGVGVGFALHGINSILKYREADSIAKSEQFNDSDRTMATLQRSKALINIIWSVSEIALKILVVTAVASTGAILLMGLISAGLGICTFLYSEHVTAETYKIFINQQ